MNQSVEQLQSDLSRLLDRVKYYGEAPTVEALREVYDLVLELNSDEIYDQECLDAEYSRGLEEGQNESQEIIESLREEIKELQASLQARPKRGRKTDPFKNRTPEQMRQTLQVIKGALDEYD